MNIWKSYMRTTGSRIIWQKVIAVIDATFAAAKRKLEKSSGLYGIRTLDLCGTGAALCQLPTNWLVCSFSGAVSGWDVARVLRSCNTLPIPDSVQMPFAYPLQEKKILAFSPTVIIPRINSSYPRPNAWKPYHSRRKLAVPPGIGSRPILDQAKDLLLKKGDTISIVGIMTFAVRYD